MLSDEEINEMFLNAMVLTTFHEKKFSEKVAEVQDEKIREALISLAQLSNARHTCSIAHAEVCAHLSDYTDDRIASILLPIKEKFDENMKYLKDKK